MAQMPEFKITQELRPCTVNGRRALFHRWVESSRPARPHGKENDPDAEYYQVHSVHALVEYEDGTVAREWPSLVKFLPHPQFTDTAWVPWTMEEIRND